MGNKINSDYYFKYKTENYEINTENISNSLSKYYINIKDKQYIYEYDNNNNENITKFEILEETNTRYFIFHQNNFSNQLEIIINNNYYYDEILDFYSNLKNDVLFSSNKYIDSIIIIFNEFIILKGKNISNDEYEKIYVLDTLNNIEINITNIILEKIKTIDENIMKKYKIKIKIINNNLLINLYSNDIFYDYMLIYNFDMKYIVKIINNKHFIILNKNKILELVNDSNLNNRLSSYDNNYFFLIHLSHGNIYLYDNNLFYILFNNIKMTSKFINLVYLYLNTDQCPKLLLKTNKNFNFCMC